MFTTRSSELEIMDDLHCKGEVVEQTLRELNTINTWLGGNQITLNAVDRIIEKISSQSLTRPLCIADLGCGSGDILKHIAKKARAKKIPVELIGIDANPFIIEYAKTNTKGFPEIHYQTIDVLSEKFREQQFDIVNCTLFCHHFDNETLIRFLKQLYSQTSYSIIINDIHRHWFAYYSIKWLTYFFSSSSMVKYDAKLSVLRAFRKKELESVVRAAELRNYSIQWRWAFRYEVLIDVNKN